MTAFCIKLEMHAKYGRSRQDFRFWDGEATFLDKDVKSSEAIEIDLRLHACIINHDRIAHSVPLHSLWILMNTVNVSFAFSYKPILF